MTVVEPVGYCRVQLGLSVSQLKMVDDTGTLSGPVEYSRVI